MKLKQVKAFEDQDGNIFKGEKEALLHVLTETISDVWSLDEDDADAFLDLMFANYLELKPTLDRYLELAPEQFAANDVEDHGRPKSTVSKGE